MNNKISLVIRTILTIVMVYIVFQETGLATSVSIALIFLYIELQSILNSRIVKALEQGVKQ